MSWERDDNFNDEQIRGIDLSIKAITKKYPFIKGWKFINNYQRWKSGLYITVIVDWYEVGEFYHKELKPYWENDIKKGYKVESSIIDSFMFNNPSHSDEGFQEFFNESYNETKKISKMLNGIYSSLPPEFQITMTFKYPSSFFENEVKPVELYIENFANN